MSLAVTEDYRRTSLIRPEELLRGLDGVAQRIASKFKARMTPDARLTSEANAICEQAALLSDRSNHELREQLTGVRPVFRRRRDAGNQLAKALALVSEVAARQLNMRPYPVQVMGALTLWRGLLVEMATGEGKTLTLGLAAVLAGWEQRACHIVTANDYLARRDAEELKPLYDFCGVSVGFVTGEMSPGERTENYARDVVYTTSKELLADFLRDRLALGNLQLSQRRQIRFLLRPEQMEQVGLVQRGLHRVFVDEADNLLIDEAVTPLIISKEEKNPIFVEACRGASAIAAELRPGEDYEILNKSRSITLKPEALEKIRHRTEEMPGVFRNVNWCGELVIQALTARELFHKGRQYVIDEGKVVIVDEFTGRMMANRTWRQGLHQAIEAKEGLEVTHPSETLAKLSFQRFFRFFRHISGLSGTAREAAGELYTVYGLPVISIPTHRPCIRVQLPDGIYASAGQKWEAVVREIQRIHATGRPILAGTRSVAASELLAAKLDAVGLKYQLLNAVRHREEASIIAEAGTHGRITIATNMAGRGTDIKLRPDVRVLGGLHVIATERHESGRIDRQLFGRAGRQGDPGSAQAFVSMEDELLVRFIPAPVRTQIANALDASFPAAYKLASAAIWRAQKIAEHNAWQQRVGVMRTDTWTEEALSFAGAEIAF